MTDKTDIAALREAALKATPGKWKLGIGSTYAYVQASIDMKLGGISWVKLCHLGRAGWRNQQGTIDDASFIALANPATILAILAQLDVISKSEWNLAGDLVDAHNLLGSERQLRQTAEKERDDLKALNQHFDLAIRKSEVVNTKLREKLAKAVVPEGWKLVPIEPTESMVVDGFESKPDESFSPSNVWEAYDAMSGCGQAAHRAKLCWAAMLAAAPKPGTSNA